VVTNICGPHPGIKPMIIARRGTSTPIVVNIMFKSSGVRNTR
jgi:hypothetical protein